MCISVQFFSLTFAECRWKCKLLTTLIFCQFIQFVTPHFHLLFFAIFSLHLLPLFRCFRIHCVFAVANTGCDGEILCEHKTLCATNCSILKKRNCVTSTNLTVQSVKSITCVKQAVLHACMCVRVNMSAALQCQNSHE